MNVSENTLPAVQEIRFHDDTIIAVNVGGQIRVAIKPICEKLGVDWAHQFARTLKRDPVLSKVIAITATTSIGKDGKTYPVETVTLPLEYLNGWLFKINAARYKLEDPRREIIIRYQRECYQVLFRHFYPPCDPRGALPQPDPSRRHPRHDLALWNLRPWAYAKELHPELYGELEKRYEDLGADKHRGWESLKESIFYETEELGVILEYLVAKAPVYLESILKLQLAALGHGLVFDELDKLYGVDRVKLAKAKRAKK